MKITSARFYDYKSIIDTSTTFEPDITCLVGITGAGKTSILELLSKIDERKSFRERDLCDDSENLSKFRQGKLKANQIPQFEITFSIEEFDHDRLEEIFINVPANITMTRYFDGSWMIDPPLSTLDTVSEKIIKELDKIDRQQRKMGLTIKSLYPDIDEHDERDSFLHHFIQFSHLIHNQPEEIDKHFATYKSTIYNALGQSTIPALKETLDPFINKISQIILHIIQLQNKLPDRILYDIIPKPKYVNILTPPSNEMLLDDYLSNPDSNDTFRAIGIVCGFNKHELNNLRNDSQQRRDTFFDNTSNILTKRFNNFWNQTIHKLVITLDDEKLIFSIMNTSTNTRIKPSQSSEGIKSILSLFFKINVLLYSNNTNSSNILLLDNPAIEVHDDGKNDIRKFLAHVAEEKYAQIIYTTHEKALIDTWRKECIRFIEKDPQKGTLIHIPTSSCINSTRIAISKHIGSPAKYSLFGAPMTIFLEGYSDELFITALNRYASNTNQLYLHDDVYSLCDIGGIDNSPYYMNICDSLKVDYCFILDAGNKSRLLEHKLGEKFDRHCISLSTILDKNDADIEDLIDPVLYNKLFKLTYDDSPELDDVLKSNKKTVSFYSDWLKKYKKLSLDKIAIAGTLIKLVQSLGASKDSTLDNTLHYYIKLVEKITKMLNNNSKLSE